MLPKRNKATSQAVQNAYTKGGFRSSSNFFFLLKPKTSETNPRFAVVVSKKVSKKAVTRNRIRRRVFGALENILSSTPSELHIITVKKDISTEDFNSITSDLKQLLRIS